MTVELREFDELKKEVAELKMLLLHLTRQMHMKQTVNVKDVAEMEGVSVSSLRGSCRYLLPDYGKSQYDDGQDRWDNDYYFTWRSLSPDQRRRAFKEQQARRSAAE